MQTITLKIDDNFCGHFLEIIKSIPKDKIQLIDSGSIDPFSVSSTEEVQKRVHEAEKRISNGDYLTETQYQEELKNFTKTLS
jgi:hypothetical protein